MFERHTLLEIARNAKLLLRQPRTFVQYVAKVLQPTQRFYRRRFAQSLEDWLAYHQRQVVFEQCSWMGVKTLKNPLDVWVYQEIVHRVQPDVIVEIGSAAGGSTLYFAQLCDLLGKGAVISIDIDRSNYHVSHPRITTLTGHSSSPELVAQVYERCVGKTTLVIHDGDHHKPQVLRDLRAYADLVSLHSYLIVEDGIVDLFRLRDGFWGLKDGPLAAVEVFLREDPRFAVDHACERYLLTYNPRGYLKRIR
ncbi:CmcI family methyltransferase [Candidatus Viridilinea mediisalina]|uniref:Uncharacterized protein n=1 Tax=Candidatus Viridilinea mediisalina TaxID=2024553 RepID=A0A2A6RLS8_9CHLR|nr:CmcI family methyltransferase [Candidatus Viridilinea mediisalina]PDW03893.1 hypothetical protein CJ255_06475 [Candidatus Viridilinea mediisalina]